MCAKIRPFAGPKVPKRNPGVEVRRRDKTIIATLNRVRQDGALALDINEAGMWEAAWRIPGAQDFEAVEFRPATPVESLALREAHRSDRFTGVQARVCRM